MTGADQGSREPIPVERLIEAAILACTGAGQSVQPPATAAAIEAARLALWERFRAILPDRYASLLARVDGIDLDGLVLYGARQTWRAPGPGGFWQGLVEANQLWRDAPGHGRHLVLGETDLDLLTVDLRGEYPVLRDKVSGDVVERFATLDDALRRLIQPRI